MKGPISFVRKSWQLNHNKTANTLERNLSRRDDGGSQRLLFIAYEEDSLTRRHGPSVVQNFENFRVSKESPCYSAMSCMYLSNLWILNALALPCK